MRITDLGHHVWIGDFEACDQRSAEFPRVIHIWSRENFAEKRACTLCVAGATDGLVLEMTEGDPLSAHVLDGIAEYARPIQPLFVHCAGGVCRSATVALVCKIARGCEPFTAIHEMYKTLWTNLGYTPLFLYEPMRDILNWWAQRQEQ